MPTEQIREAMDRENDKPHGMVREMADGVCRVSVRLTHRGTMKEAIDLAERLNVFAGGSSADVESFSLGQPMPRT